MLIGIVGKPSVGKSTFFQALTEIPVPRASYPFTTIKPNRGIGYVRVKCVDREFGVQCNPKSGFCKNGVRYVPVELMDVAGLVPGAHEGRGLGNKFLDDLRQADALIHIVDASGGTNEEGEKVPSGSYDPIKDIIFLEEELDYWILGILERNWKKLERENERGEKNEDILEQQLSGLGINKEAIKETLKSLGLGEKKMKEWGEEEKKRFAKRIREIGKPILIAANKCDVPEAKENIKRMKERFPNYIIIPTSAEAELTLKEAAKKGYVDYLPGDSRFEIKKELNEQQRKGLEIIKKIMEECGGTGVQEALDKTVFQLLKYIAVFPGGVNKLADKEGNVLPDCFLLPPGSTALDFARAIHSDMAKKFIKAIDVRTKMVHGEDWKLKHRDVVEIVFGK